MWAETEEDGEVIYSEKRAAREVNLPLPNDWELSQQSRTIRELREELEVLAGVPQSLPQAAENSSIDLASHKVQQRGGGDLAKARRVVEVAEEGPLPPQKIV